MKLGPQFGLLSGKGVSLAIALILLVLLGLSSVEIFFLLSSDTAQSHNRTWLALNIFRGSAILLLLVLFFRALLFRPPSTGRHSISLDQVLAVCRDAIWQWQPHQPSRVWLGFGTQGLFTDKSPWPNKIHPHDRTAVLASFASSVDCRETSWSCRYRVDRSGDRYAVVEDRATLTYDAQGAFTQAVGALTDITDQRQGEAELKRLSTQLIEAQENERRRVARELHDSVNQFLSAAKLQWQTMANRLSLSSKDAQQAERSIELIQRATDEVRRISQNLRPCELDGLGLTPSLRSMCREFQDRTGLPLTLLMQDIPKHLPPEIELCLYRIAQESLANVEKHARANSVTVSLSKHATDLHLTIVDDGQGIASHPTTATSPTGMGLPHIRERAAGLGGRAAIQSDPGKGTRVLVQVPFRPISERLSLIP